MLFRADKLVLVLGGAVMVASTVVAFAEPPSVPAATVNMSASSVFKQPTSLAELLALPVDYLDKVDVGLINIL